MLKVGQVWETRSGREVTITEVNKAGSYVKASNSLYYRSNGRLGNSEHDSGFDLVYKISDPAEVVPDSNASRYNEGKVDLSLIPVEASMQECKVWQAGAKKYTRNNWKKLWGDDTVNVAMASLLRHAFKILEGEEKDEESGLYHAAHIRCNAAMLLEYYKKEREKDASNS